MVHQLSVGGRVVEMGIGCQETLGIALANGFRFPLRIGLGGLANYLGELVRSRLVGKLAVGLGLLAV
jgi:hypothetical protein